MAARTPMQGGLPPAATTGAVVEIACDESGFSGTNLLSSDAPVITHASVDLTVGEAAALVAALRSEFKLAPYEVKSGQVFRRPGSGPWLLAALAGRAHVQVVDKELFVVTRIFDLLLAEPTYAAGTRLAPQHQPAALFLRQAGRTAGSDWDVFLAAFVDLVRMKRRHPARADVDRFLHARDALTRRGITTGLDDLDPARIWAVLTRLDHDDRAVPPPLEPLLPALAETVLTWSAGGRRVLVTHDEQSALTADRLTRLQAVLGGALAGLVVTDSRDDPRVQVADLLAGLTRRTVSGGG